MNINRIEFESDEKVLLQVRKHWFLLVAELFAIVFVAILPYFLYIFVREIPKLSEFAASKIGAGVVIALLCAWLLIIWMVLFNIWINYYLDIWTITNKRLIAVDQKGFFYRTTASFRLERMQDIEISVDGILATFLDYGTLEIQTAGEEPNFRVTGLPYPGEIKAAILKASDVLSHHKHDHTEAGL